MFYSTLNGGDTKPLSVLVSKVNACKDEERPRGKQVGFIGTVTTSEEHTITLLFLRILYLMLSSFPPEFTPQTLLEISSSI